MRYVEEEIAYFPWNSRVESREEGKQVRLALAEQTWEAPVL